jgi:hypothetical protein
MEAEMFHWKDNFYFGRLPDGFVRMVKFSASPQVMQWHNELVMKPTEYPRVDGEFHSVEVVLDLRISPLEWASIIASMSRLGESDGRFQKALSFHNELPPASQGNPHDH